VGDESVKEEMPFSKAPLIISNAAGVLATVSALLFNSWKRLIGVRTDCGPAVLDPCSGFMTLVRENNAAINGIDDVVDRQTLAAKTLPDDVYNCLNLSVL
jgi:hypothetical protein